jgi:hypothetical protein
MSRIDELMASAAKVGEHTKPGNYMNVTWTDQKATLTTVIGNKPLAWIDYYPAHLDELILILQRARSEMT